MKRNIDALWKECVGEVQGGFAPNNRPNRIPYTDTPANTMGISSMSAVKDSLDPGAARTIGYDGFLFARRLFVHQCFPNTEETAELFALQKPDFFLVTTVSSVSCVREEVNYVRSVQRACEPCTRPFSPQ